MDISFLGSDKREIKNTNKRKVGAPFDTFLLISSF
jgi:hypothetical protein